MESNKEGMKQIRDGVAGWDKVRVIVKKQIRDVGMSSDKLGGGYGSQRKN